MSLFFAVIAFLNLASELRKRDGRRRLSVADGLLSVFLFSAFTVPVAIDDCFINPIGICAIQILQRSSVARISFHIATIAFWSWISLLMILKNHGLDPEKPMLIGEQKGSESSEEEVGHHEESHVERAKRQNAIACFMCGPISLVCAAFFNALLKPYQEVIDPGQTEHLGNTTWFLFNLQTIFIGFTESTILRQYTDITSYCEFVGDDSRRWVKFRWCGFDISRHDIQIVLCILSVFLLAALVLIYFLCSQDHLIAVLSAGCISASKEALRLICRLHAFVVMAPLALGYMGVLGNAQPPVSLVGTAVPKVILPYTISWFLN
jgi:hypothetical protein